MLLPGTEEVTGEVPPDALLTLAFLALSLGIPSAWYGLRRLREMAPAASEAAPATPLELALAVPVLILSQVVVASLVSYLMRRLAKEVPSNQDTFLAIAEHYCTQSYDILDAFQSAANAQPFLKPVDWQGLGRPRDPTTTPPREPLLAAAVAPLACLHADRCASRGRARRLPDDRDAADGPGHDQQPPRHQLVRERRRAPAAAVV